MGDGCNEAYQLMARNPKLDVLKSAIRKEHGNVVVSMASAIADVPRVSTCSLAMDRAFGGGFPAGRITILRGKESGGKTVTAYRAIGNAQNLCANCFRPARELEFVEDVDDEGEVILSTKGYCDCFKEGIFKTVPYPDEKKPEYKARLKELEENSYEEFRTALVDVEHVFEPSWASCLGIDPRRLLYMRPYTAEQAIDIYDEFLRTGAVHMLVLDSIAALEPKEELEKSSYEATQGLMARKMGIFVRKAASAMNYVSQYYRKLPIQIWINQEREKIGLTWGDNKVMPAGLAQLFASSLTVKMWASKWEKETQDEDLIKDFQSEIGTRVRINFKTEKSRVAPAMQRGSYTMWVSGENKGKIDEFKYFWAMAEKFGLIRIEGDGPKRKWFLGDEEYSKKGDAIDRVNQPEVYAEMRRIILDKMLGVK